MSAFSHTEQEPMLLSASKADLDKATDLYDVFDVLTTEYASFINYDIFQYIIDKYRISERQELKYPEHLNSFVTKLKISEFVKINPLLKKFTSASKKLILKVHIKSTSRLAKITNLKVAIATILGLGSATLQLLDVNDGCVVVTFLIPTPVAELIFYMGACTLLTEHQKEQFRALSILWLECNNHTFYFSEDLQVFTHPVTKT